MEQVYSTTKQLLLGAAVPEKTRTYIPFSHERVIDLTLEGIEKAGFKLDKELYSSVKEGVVATGKYVIKNVADEEMQLQIAWLNSYNKSKRLTWGIGGVVRICMNGMISADMGAFKKKHQGDITDYSPKAITEYIKKAAEVFENMQKEREAMKQVQIDKTITAHILGEMFLNEDFITTTQLNIIKREVLNPSFDYKSDNSLWQLYNHSTLSLKEIHPSLFMDAHMDAHKYFVNKAGILVNSSKIEIPTDEYHISPNQLGLFVREEDFVTVETV